MHLHKSDVSGLSFSDVRLIFVIDQLTEDLAYDQVLSHAEERSLSFLESVGEVGYNNTGNINVGKQIRSPVS